MLAGRLLLNVENVCFSRRAIALGSWAQEPGAIARRLLKEVLVMPTERKRYTHTKQASQYVAPCNFSQPRKKRNMRKLSNQETS